MQKTLVVLKPDAVRRGIVGQVITRFERVGLQVAAAKMIVPDDKLLNKHYPHDRTEFVEGLGHKAIKGFKEVGVDAKEKFGNDDPAKIGEEVRKWLVDFMKSGPVLAMVIEGPHAIPVVRKLVGPTMPNDAPPGTIRGDFSFESSSLANETSRPVRNMIHASGNEEEAEFEVNLWFTPEELYEYDTVHQKSMLAD